MVLPPFPDDPKATLPPSSAAGRRKSSTAGWRCMPLWVARQPWVWRFGRPSQDWNPYDSWCQFYIVLQCYTHFVCFYVTILIFLSLETAGIELWTLNSYHCLDDFILLVWTVPASHVWGQSRTAPEGFHHSDNPVKVAWYRRWSKKLVFCANDQQIQLQQGPDLTSPSPHRLLHLPVSRAFSFYYRLLSTNRDGDGWCLIFQFHWSTAWPHMGKVLFCYLVVSTTVCGAFAEPPGFERIPGWKVGPAEVTLFLSTSNGQVRFAGTGKT